MVIKWVNKSGGNSADDQADMKGPLDGKARNAVADVENTTQDQFNLIWGRIRMSAVGKFAVGGTHFIIVAILVAVAVGAF